MKREDGMQPPELPFCACGCGGRVTKLGNKYIHGHNSKSNHPMKDKHQSEETKQKIAWLRRLPAGRPRKTRCSAIRSHSRMYMKNIQYRLKNGMSMYPIALPAEGSL